MQRVCAVLWRHFWPLWLHHIFWRYLINGAIFGKKVAEHKMCVLIFSTTFVWTISHSASWCHKCKNNLMKNNRYFCLILMKIEFSGQFLEKVSNIKFNQNPSSGSRCVLCVQTDGLTDRHDEANSHFSQFCQRANKRRELGTKWNDL